MRSSFGHGRMVVCEGIAPGGRRCQRAVFLGRGCEGGGFYRDGTFNCGDHFADHGKPTRPEHRVSTRRKARRRWEKRL
jgi:hypothetical protein